MAKLLKDKTGSWYGGEGVYLTPKQSDTNARCIAKFCKNLSKHEWKKKPCCAMMGNMWRESHLNPQFTEVGGGGGYGLVQWTPKSNLVNRAKKIKMYKSYDMMYTQLCVIDYEADNHLQWGQTSSYPISFKEFMKDDTHSIEWLTRCFCANYERAGVTAMDERIEYANRYYDKINWDRISSDDGGAVDDFLEWCKKIADNNDYTYQLGANHGVPWNNDEHLKKFDCSSFISFGLHNGGGYDLPTQFATSNMRDGLTALGFEAIKYVNKSKLKRGDILVNEGVHTEAVYSVNNGNIKLVGAHKHYPTHPQDDIDIGDFYEDNWGWILRPFDSPSSKPRENPTNSNKSNKKKNPKTPSANTQNTLPPTFLKRRKGRF